MDSWNGMELIKNDFLTNRSNITIEGNFDYKKNVALWKEQTDSFQVVFNDLLDNTQRLRFFNVGHLSIQQALSLWNSTYKSIVRLQETLEQLERVGLNDLVFPQMIHNFSILRDTDRINFDDTVLLMNLVNQFSFLDISSKEFSRIIKSFVFDIQQRNEDDILYLTILAGVLILLLATSVSITFLSIRKLHESDLIVNNFKREEQLTTLRHFITGQESYNNVIDWINQKEFPILTGNPVIPVLLRVIHFSEERELKGPLTVEMGLATYAKSIETYLKDNNFLCTAISLEDAIIVYHVLHGSLLAESILNRTEILIDSLKGYLATHKDLSFSITYGPVHQFPEEAQENYLELYEASFYRILHGYKKTISSEEMKSRKMQKYSYPIQEEKKLGEYLKQGKIEQAKSTYYSILKSLTDSNYVSMKNGIYRLVVAITSALDTLEKFNNLSNHIDINMFTQKIYAMETIDEIDAAISSLIDEVAGELVQKKEGYTYHQVSRVNEIIFKEYPNPNLSTNLISERLGLSTVYLGRIFRTQTGTSVQDTINLCRMEAAKELLEKEKTTIEEISKTVGISNTMYFYTLFKKQYGMTPKEFRQNCRRE
jgi:AraC-like DNA-binding protein